MDVECVTPILSDDDLFPHWEQLANAIQLRERIEALSLCNVQLDARTLQMIEASVRQKDIATFGLTGNSFHGGEGEKFAIDVLKSNKKITRFGWAGNNFHSIGDACTLVDAILEQPQIESLALMSLFSEGIILYTPVKRLFCGVGNGTLLSINLYNNGIKTNGDRCIPDFLSANPPLQLLDLEGNKLTDDDALHIAQALQSNTNLNYLDLEKNTLTTNGKSAAYCQAIYGLYRSDPSESMSLSEVNLNLVSEANHTCKIIGIVSEKAFMNDNDEPAKQNRREKLFQLLVMRHHEGCNISLLESEFTENCMGLVPHVLACVSTYSSTYSGGIFEQKCLSVIFELVQTGKCQRCISSAARLCLWYE